MPNKGYCKVMLLGSELAVVDPAILFNHAFPSELSRRAGLVSLTNWIKGPTYL